jgi:hypothetical protein
MPGKSRKRSQSPESKRKRQDQFERRTGSKKKSEFRSRPDSSGDRSSRRRFQGDDGRLDPNRFEKMLSRMRSGGDGEHAAGAVFENLGQRSKSALATLLRADGAQAQPLSKPADHKVRAEAIPAPAVPKFMPSRSYRAAAKGEDKHHAPEPAESQSPPSPKSSGRPRKKASTESPAPELAPVAHSAPNASSPIALDEWQRTAFDHLLAGRHVVVDAPTSAGKTRVIEALLDAKMATGLKLIYTSPVKSLSNDKYREFSARYGREAVGINTGDFKENLGAPIILATLETYRNSLLGLEPDMSRKVVVYDEYHYLQDESRGSAWEESIILTPKGSQLVLLSASVPNAEDFANWIAGVTGEPAEVVRVTKRPVPLVDLVHTSGGWVLASELKLTPEELEKLKASYVQERRRMRRQVRNKSFYAELLGDVQQALENDLGPIVVYAARRAEVESLAHAMARLASQQPVQSHASSPTHSKLLERLENLSGWEYVPSELKTMVSKYGVAFHHSGMIPPARVAIESLLKEGLLRVCMGTMGISLGVNFAVRSAFIADESRPGESGEKAYSNSEILQMLGRAGRRGHDKQGFSLWSDLGKYARFRPTERERCESSLKFDPSTVLGLVDRNESYALVSEFYKKSLFMRGQDRESVLITDHDTLSAAVFQKTGGSEQHCKNIPEIFRVYELGKQRSQVACTQCPSRKECHPLVLKSRASPLQLIVSHLEEVGAIKHQQLTKLGKYARHFPQSGGLLIAHWLASGQMQGSNFGQFAQALAVFCSAHFKEIPEHYCDKKFIADLRMDTEIEFFYPYDLFPEYYDEVKGHVGEYESPYVYRELNFGAPSIIQAWLRPKMTWEKLVADHSTKYFSAGDCMMVLFRFATYLQSCIRLSPSDPALGSEAKRMLHTILREPLDARNRMLLEEVEEEERLEPEIAAAIEAEAESESDAGLEDTAGNT